jgi:hypothetical protein
MNIRSKVITSLLLATGDRERGLRRLPDVPLLHCHTFRRCALIWGALGRLVSDFLPKNIVPYSKCVNIEHSQSRSHPGRPSSTHPHAKHTPSPVPSSSSSGFTHSHVQEQIQGIAPQPMRYAFTYPGAWLDRPQRARTRDSAGDAMRARTSTSSPYPTSLPSQERVGKRKRPASTERNTPVPRTAATHRDSVGPQRSHRRHHNVAEKTHSTLLPSGGMYMTFPLDIPSPEPDTEGAVKAGPSPFEHGPTELPPRPYEKEKAEPEVGGPERPGKKGRLPADVMDHVRVLIIYYAAF